MNHTTRGGQTATLLLAAYTLNQHGVYAKEMITFKADFHRDVEVTLSVCEKPSGEFEFTTEDIRLPQDIPEPPEPNDVPRPVTTVELKDTATLSFSLDLSALPPTLPENPTAEERWTYLLEILKQKASD